MNAIWIITSSALVAAIAVSVLVARRGRRATAQVRHIRIHGGYLPPEVHVRAGEPARLVFRREEHAPCSEYVVFPDFGISVMLPPFEDVPVDLPPGEPGEHVFTCKLDVFRGKVVVDDRQGDHAASSRPRTPMLEGGSDERHGPYAS